MRSPKECSDYTECVKDEEEVIYSDVCNIAVFYVCRFRTANFSNLSTTKFLAF